MPALLFDLYGVLLRVQDPEHLARIEEAAGHSGEAFWSAYWDCRPDYDAGLVSTPGYWSRGADRLDAPIRDVADAHEQDMASWLAGDPEMIAYVTGLADAGARTALLSNIPVPLAERVLVAHPWLQRLDPLLLSGRIGLAKPDPRLFAHALEALGAPAGEVLFVDDRDENVAAAESVGMAGHVFTGIDGLRPVVEAHLGR